jgi:hypothetical protein
MGSASGGMGEGPSDRSCPSFGRFRIGRDHAPESQAVSLTTGLGIKHCLTVTQKRTCEPGACYIWQLFVEDSRQTCRPPRLPSRIKELAGFSAPNTYPGIVSLVSIVVDGGEFSRIRAKPPGLGIVGSYKLSSSSQHQTVSLDFSHLVVSISTITCQSCPVATIWRIWEAPRART